MNVTDYILYVDMNIKIKNKEKEKATEREENIYPITVIHGKSQKKIPVFHTGTHILNGLWNNDGVMGKGR